MQGGMTYEPSAEEVEATVAEQMANLPPWWGDDEEAPVEQDWERARRWVTDQHPDVELRWLPARSGAGARCHLFDGDTRLTGETGCSRESRAWLVAAERLGKNFGGGHKRRAAT